MFKIKWNCVKNAIKSINIRVIVNEAILNGTVYFFLIQSFICVYVTLDIRKIETTRPYDFILSKITIGIDPTTLGDLLCLKFFP